MQIFEALIEKAPRDLPLYARYVLKVLNLILKSEDITMIEASIPTFEAFCEHHDGASLSADQEYLKQYEEIVRTYTSFASTSSQSPILMDSAPIAMRWKVAGLRAVKSVASSQALASVAGRQLDVIMPIVLENLWTDDQQYLEILLNRAHLEEKVDTEKLLRRRGSIATVRTVETSTDTNPLALSGTTADADKLAEEDIGVLAIQCLKQIFVINNRSQIRGATLATVKFIADRVRQGELLVSPQNSNGEDRGWTTTIFLMIARWAPVQERYTILVTAMEALVRSSLSEDSVPQELILATMIGSLLRSDINLIGLSVMDVLLGLIQHVLRLLQLSGAKPHFQPTDSVGLDNSPSMEMSPAASSDGVATDELVSTPSRGRVDLLHRLENCIGDLATHVYYADQISDMISTILLRLKPTPASAIPSSAAAIEDPETASNVVSASANLVEDPNTDGFFSFDTAKVSALTTVKSILLVATKRSKMVGASLERNRVGLHVWESTQWLLRDADGKVRKAYADALLTWLDREMRSEDLLVLDDKPLQTYHRGLVQNGGDDSTDNLSRRAVSTTSHREKTAKSPRTTFIQLVHLAIYENALQYTDSEPDIILLHLLLVKLVDKLGVNAVKCGLPMIFRLQEDIQEAETVAKVRMGSLCHGYFWALSEKFDFESSGIGREIHNEIYRRQSKGLWVKAIRLPPVSLNDLGIPGTISTHQGLPVHELESESLKPFDDRETMVELISLSYSENVAGMSSSPAASPGRSFSHPILSHPQDVAKSIESIPEKIKEQMLSDWSRESILASVAAGSKSVSLNGSKTGTNRTGQVRNYLTVNGNSRAQSPHSQHHHRSRPPSQAYGLVGGINAVSKLRQTTGLDHSPSDSSKTSITRVDQLKRVLSGQAPPSRGIGALDSDSSSESMVSYDASPSEFSYDNRATIAETGRFSDEVARSKSRDRADGVEDLKPLSSHPVTSDSGNPLSGSDGAKKFDDGSLPPVPPLPTSISIPGGFSGNISLGHSINSKTAAPELSLGEYLQSGRSHSRGRQSQGVRSIKGDTWNREPSPGMNLELLLKGIQTGNDGQKVAGMVEPPY